MCCGCHKLTPFDDNWLQACPSGFLGEYHSVCLALEEQGAVFVTVADLDRARDVIDPTALRCPAWDTLLSAQVGTDPSLFRMVPPFQRRVTTWFGPRGTEWGTSSLSEDGRSRALLWAQYPTAIRPAGDVGDATCPFVAGLDQPSGTIRHSPVSFLAFTGGTHAASFGFGMHLFRLWFCWWLGLDLPRSLAESNVPREQQDLCRCGAYRDGRGFHRLACFRGDVQALARTRGHDFIADVISDCAHGAGLRGAVRLKVPTLPNCTERGDLSIEIDIPRPDGLCPTRGLVGDVSLVSIDVGASADSAQWGTRKPEALAERERDKDGHYAQRYAAMTTPWTFVPLVCSTYGHLRPRLLRLINLLAERQARLALETDMMGEQPDRLVKIIRHRLLGRVACAVAVATAMRLGGHWADIHHPVRLPPRRPPALPYTAETDLPLFPRGSEDAPVASLYPLPRGPPSDDLFGRGGATGG